MKNWRAALLLAVACVAALLSSLTTVLVLSSAFFPVDDWLAGAATAWQLPARWAHARRRLWRRVGAALRGDALAAPWRAPRDEIDAEFASEDSDSDEDDDCLGHVTDWKHGRICLISR